METFLLINRNRPHEQTSSMQFALKIDNFGIRLQLHEIRVPKIRHFSVELIRRLIALF